MKITSEISDMLSYAGVGVAMWNALDEVKAISDLNRANEGRDRVYTVMTE